MGGSRGGLEQQHLALGGALWRENPHLTAAPGGGGQAGGAGEPAGWRSLPWSPAPTPCSSLQVNMVIGILVFNKLVSKDGITDKKLKERAG